MAHAADPARVLLGLNQALCGKFQHHYVTAAYLFLDMEKRTLTYAGAGHPPLLLWGGSSEGVRVVEENGLFLGKFEFARYSSVELPLASGDWALLYTDGISETTDPFGVDFDPERYHEFLAEERPVPRRILEGRGTEMASLSSPSCMRRFDIVAGVGFCIS